MRTIIFLAVVGLLAYMTYNRFDEIALKKDRKLQEEETLKLQVRKQAKKLKEIEEFKKNFEESKQLVEMREDQLEEVRKRLPDFIDDNEVLGTFKNEMEYLNILKTNFALPVEKEKGFYFERKYSGSFVGTYLQTMVLFERISKKDRLYNIHSLKLVKSGNSGSYQLLTASVDFEVYRYNKDYIDEDLLESQKKKSPKRGRRK